MLTKILLGLFSMVIGVIIQIAVMIHGWGLSPKSYAAIIIGALLSWIVAMGVSLSIRD